MINNVTAQDDEEYSAEASINLANRELPGIKKNWTKIDLVVNDAFGLPWDLLKDKYRPIVMQTWWRILYQIPDIERYLGYTSLVFEVDESSLPRGWSVKFEPSTISETTTYRTHRISVYMQINELASVYNPTIKIKCIRYDTLGGYYGTTYINLPVKAASLNYAFLEAKETTKKAPPKSIVKFPIEIRNSGEYVGTYKFDIDDMDGTLSLISEQGLILQPGEKRTVELSVLTPERFYDMGTNRQIKVKIHPVGHPSDSFETDVIVITEGFYISPLIGIIAAPIIIIILLIIAFFYYQRRRKITKIIGPKPEKPWEIPEEREYLEELKIDDEKKYEKVRRMMEKEYESAMLWYDYYIEAMNKKPKTERNGRKVLNDFFKNNRKTKVKKEKPKRQIKPKEEKPEQQETPDIVKTQYEAIQKRKIENQKKKQKALEKIRKEQDKQKRNK